MQVNSIPAYGYTPNVNRTKYSNNRTQTPQSQVNFTSNKDHHKSRNNGLRKAAIATLFVPLSATVGTGMISSCSTDDFDTIYLKPDTFRTEWEHVLNDTTIERRDTLLKVITENDTVVIDTGSYHTDTVTIKEWIHDWERPTPNDSIVKNLQNWGVDSTENADINDGSTKRNIIHWEGTREWEYNYKEIGDVNLAQSSKNKDVYDMDIRDVKGKHKRYEKAVVRTSNTSGIKLVDEDGDTIRNPKGFFVEFYDNKTGHKNAQLEDCERNNDRRYFCRTVGDSIEVFKRNEDGIYEAKGNVQEGYLDKAKKGDSVLLRNLIGMYPTDDHFVDTKLILVDDNKLLNLYLRQRDDEEYEKSQN